MLVPYTFEPGETTIVITLVNVAEIRTELQGLKAPFFNAVFGCTAMQLLFPCASTASRGAKVESAGFPNGTHLLMSCK